MFICTEIALLLNLNVALGNVRLLLFLNFKVCVGDKVLFPQEILSLLPEGEGSHRCQTIDCILRGAGHSHASAGLDSELILPQVCISTRIYFIVLFAFFQMYAIF